MANTPQRQPELINVLPPGSQGSGMYCVIDVLNPGEFGLDSAALSSYYLHMPKELNNVFSMNWEQSELGGDILSSLFTGNKFTGGGAGRDSAAIGMSTILSATVDATQSVGIGAGAAAGVRASAGIAKNPVTTLLFQNSNLRNFQFSWDLIPLDRQLSNRYEKMIKEFRVKMHPRLDTNSTFTTPNLFRIKLMIKGKYMIHTLPCAMTNLTINGFGSGLPAFHEDGTPVHTVMTIELQEVVQQTQKSIERLYGT